MSSTPMYHPDDDETNPHPEDQGFAQPDEGASGARTVGDETRPSRDGDSSTTDLDELNDEGVGGTFGAEDTFEPEESDGPRGSGSGGSPQG